MVVVNDFEVKIVSAEDNDNTPFTEHEKDSKIYVEIEPDAEYFVAVRKVKPSSGRLCYSIHVDGKKLGFRKCFYPQKVESSPKLCGIWSLSIQDSTRLCTYKALKFKSRSLETPQVKSEESVLGKIVVYVHSIDSSRKRKNGNHDVAGSSFDANADGVPTQESSQSRKTNDKEHNLPTVTPTCDRKSTKTVGMAESNEEASQKVSSLGTMEKHLRSEEGTREVQYVQATSASPERRYRTGRFLYSITLHYCLVPGLVAVGVLPSSEHHRSNTIDSKNENGTEKWMASVKQDESGNDILELKDDDTAMSKKMKVTVNERGWEVIELLEDSECDNDEVSIMGFLEDGECDKDQDPPTSSNVPNNEDPKSESGSEKMNDEEETRLMTGLLDEFDSGSTQIT